MFKCVLLFSITLFLINVGCLYADLYPKIMLRCDCPDPAIMRDCNEYYKPQSPYVHLPGFLIWHSKVFVDWKPICRAMTDVVGSAMAPDLVTVAGRDYVCFPASGTNWFIWADIIVGLWSDPIDLKVSYFDTGYSVCGYVKCNFYLSEGLVAQLFDDGLSTVGNKL